jgi:hypothetical protein
MRGAISCHQADALDKALDDEAARKRLNEGSIPTSSIASSSAAAPARSSSVSAVAASISILRVAGMQEF